MPVQWGTPEPVTGIVVAGGKSARLGQDKRRLCLWGPAGPTLLEHTVAFVAEHCREVIVVLNDSEAWPALPARVVRDEYTDGGSLGGIYSGLMAATFPYAFAVAADMPLLNHDLVAWMIQHPRDYDVLVPRVGQSRARNRLGVESLHAMYSHVCREPIRRQLEAGNPQVIGFFPEVRVSFVEPDVLYRFDPDGTAFKNINTSDDLQAVQTLLGDTLSSMPKDE